MENWIDLGGEADITEGLHHKAVGGRTVVVARLSGRLYAFEALCPHAQGPMERSEIEGAIVTCPLHAWRFDLENDGKELHGYRSLSTYPVKVQDGRVFVRLHAA